MTPVLSWLWDCIWCYLSNIFFKNHRILQLDPKSSSYHKTVIMAQRRAIQNIWRNIWLKINMYNIMSYETAMRAKFSYKSCISYWEVHDFHVSISTNRWMYKTELIQGVFLVAIDVFSSHSYKYLFGWFPPFVVQSAAYTWVKFSPDNNNSVGLFYSIYVAMCHTVTNNIHCNTKSYTRRHWSV